jgi:integrase
MADHQYDPKARKAMKQFVDLHGKRRTLRLNNVSKTMAGTFYAHVDNINEARRTGQTIPGDTLNYLNSLAEPLHKKLARVGLVEPRVVTVKDAATPQVMTLEYWLESYIAKRTDVKAGTRTFYGHTQRNLIDFFGANKLICDITEGDADDFRRYLQTHLESDATVNRRCGQAKTFFRAAVRYRLLAENPFRDLDASVKSNQKRQYFVERSVIDDIVDEAPDAEWRLLIALARYGGLRIPSEALSLRWSDVNWEKQRITVTSPKTEHHEGRGSRVIPMFPELVEPLRDAWEQAGDGAEFVIQRHRPESVKTDSGNWRGANLRTQFKKFVERAGHKPWPRLWQNLRSSRETELCSDHPLHVVCQWIGNTERIAARHYLQITDEHFEKALHIALQSGAESGGTEGKPAPVPKLNPDRNNASRQKRSGSTMIRETACMGDTGFEPVTSTV